VIVYKDRAITLSAAMTDLDRPEHTEDPKELRSAAVDALKDAARQSDPEEFNRLTRHALTLIERARAIGHRRRHALSDAPETEASRNATRSDRAGGKK
jgi:formiminotetrahydrofolate cyclodeaminase